MEFPKKYPEWIYIEKEGIYLANLVLTDEFEIDLVKIPPKRKLREHYHIRPNNGVEIFIFPFEGKYKVIINGKEFENVKYVKIKSYEKHSVINLDDKDLIFLAIYVPPFKEGEVILTE